MDPRLLFFKLYYKMRALDQPARLEPVEQIGVMPNLVQYEQRQIRILKQHIHVVGYDHWAWVVSWRLR